MSALDDLIAAVESGSCPRESILSARIWHEVGNVLGAFGGSLEAAKALHNALLPEWLWWRDEKGRFWVGSGFAESVGRSSEPSRAWLLAILEALKAQGGAA